MAKAKELNDPEGFGDQIDVQIEGLRRKSEERLARQAAWSAGRIAGLGPDLCLIASKELTIEAAAKALSVPLADLADFKILIDKLVALGFIARTGLSKDQVKRTEKEGNPPRRIVWDDEQKNVERRRQDLIDFEASLKFVDLNMLGEASKALEKERKAADRLKKAEDGARRREQNKQAQQRKREKEAQAKSGESKTGPDKL